MLVRKLRRWHCHGSPNIRYLHYFRFEITERSFARADPKVCYRPFADNLGSTTCQHVCIKPNSNLRAEDAWAHNHLGESVVAAEFTRWFLALFFVSVAVFYSVRITWLKQKAGRSPVYAGQPGTTHFATHLAFRVFRVAILAVCVGRLPWPELDLYLVTFDSLWHPFVLFLGSVLLLSGFVANISLHFYMGENWRSGIRVDDTTELITKGPFALSQNPMMLCVIMAQVGLFLALPSAFTLLCLAVGVWAVLVQVKVEQRLLRRRFGAVYDNYVAQTPRWLILK